jgi:glycosyltransferase involved in cell wall biosynthesis
VIPTYNRADLVLRAVASVQCQSLGDWELLVVDDASTDDTKTRIEELADSRIEYVRRAINGGVAAAQNTGLDRAAGRFVLFLHSDDELMPEFLRRLSEVLDRASPAIGGVEAGVEVIESGSATQRRPYLEGGNVQTLLAFQSGVHISTFLLRRQVAADVRFDEALRTVEDRDFCIRLVRRTTLAFEGDPLIRIHRSATGLSALAKGPFYEYLLAKYHDDIVASAATHGSWWFGIARAYAGAGDLGRARAAMQRSVRVHPSRVRRWPLFAASYLGDRVLSAALRAYRVAARITNRRES